VGSWKARAELLAALAQPEQAGEWLVSGGLVYRLTKERCPQNCDEVNVTMVNGSRDDGMRNSKAIQIAAMLSSHPPAQPEGIK